MDTYAIPVEVVLGAFKRPLKVQDVDEDGAGKIDGDKPVLTDATTPMLLRMVLANIPRAIHKDDDPLRVPQVFNRLDAATDVIALKEKQYLWLHRLLARKIPLSPQEQEANGKIPSEEEKLKPVTYAYALWGNNSAVFVNYLCPLSERKNIDAED